jgi:hypothetical protein
MKRLVELEKQLELERSTNMDLERELMDTNGAKTELEKRLLLLEREIKNQNQEELKKLRNENIALRKQLQSLEGKHEENVNIQAQTRYLEGELERITGEYQILLEEKNRNESQLGFNIQELEEGVRSLKSLYEGEKRNTTNLQALLKERNEEIAGYFLLYILI